MRWTAPSPACRPASPTACSACPRCWLPRAPAKPALLSAPERQYPLGGVQTAEQVAGVMAWLLGPESDRLTGQVLAVDGGFSTVRPLLR